MERVKLIPPPKSRRGPIPGSPPTLAQIEGRKKRAGVPIPKLSAALMGHPGYMLGKKHTEATKALMSSQRLGVAKPREAVEKQRLTILGKSNPGASAWMSKNNPMKDANIASKRVAAFLVKNGGDYRDWRSNPKYDVWCLEVKNRDNFSCLRCGITEEEYRSTQRALQRKRIFGLHAHHIKTGERYPELRFDVNNGRTVCACCHRIEEAEEVQKEIWDKLKEIRKLKALPIRPITAKLNEVGA